MTPALSIVIPTFNRLEILPRVLAALESQTLDAAMFEVVVVDDGSSDGTAAFLAGHRPEFEFRTFSRPIPARRARATAASPMPAASSSFSSGTTPCRSPTFFPFTSAPIAIGRVAGSPCSGTRPGRASGA